MKVLTTATVKGGCGKTTTAAVIAQAGAYKGKKVLCIDLDWQGNLSFCMGADTTKQGSFELLQDYNPRPLIQHAMKNIDIIPASRGLATVQSSQGSARRLQKAIAPLKKMYDLIVLDTPTTGELQYNCLMAATDLVIPLQADIYNLQGFYQIVDTATQIQKANTELQITGFIFTLYDQRSTIAKQMQATIKSKAESLGIKHLATIRSGIAIKESAALQQSIYEYAPTAKPAQDYLTLYEALNI